MMAKVYATKDNENEHILENATIKSFKTEAAAIKWLLDDYDAEEWLHSTAEFEHGIYGDCWVKYLIEPTVDSWRDETFKLDDLSILRPGQHPGGRKYWIVPLHPVLVLSGISEAIKD